MRLILIRHGEAVGSSPLGDAGRCLSVRGREQAAATGSALAARGVAPTQVWASPLVRAQQTAELIVARLPHGGVPYTGVVEARDDLYPDSPVDALARALADLAADAGPDAPPTVIAVGHMPFMAVAASELLRMSVSSFGTGHAYALALAGLFPHRAQLEWRWTGA